MPSAGGYSHARASNSNATSTTPRHVSWPGGTGGSKVYPYLVLGRVCVSSSNLDPWGCDARPTTRVCRSGVSAREMARHNVSHLSGASDHNAPAQAAFEALDEFGSCLRGLLLLGFVPTHRVACQTLLKLLIPTQRQYDRAFRPSDSWWTTRVQRRQSLNDSSSFWSVRFSSSMSWIL